MELVSVIIPSYNSAQYLPEAIESVLTQTYRPLQVIVVDDGSTDDTARAVEPYRDRIRFIQKSNGGPASARNFGLKAVKGDWIAFLDADDVWLPQKLEKQMRVIEEHPEVGMVACGEYEVNEYGTRDAEHIYTNYKDKRRFLEALCSGNVIGGGSTALVRRSCLEHLGGFDEDLFGTEDWDMWLRIAFLYEVRFVEEPLMEARRRNGSVSAPVHAERMLFNELKVLKKSFAGLFPRTGFLKKRQCYSHRYLAAARTLHLNGGFKKARSYFVKSFVTYPGMIFHWDSLKIMLRLLTGSQKKGKASLRPFLIYHL